MGECERSTTAPFFRLPAPVVLPLARATAGDCFVGWLAGWGGDGGGIEEPGTGVLAPEAWRAAVAAAFLDLGTRDLGGALDLACAGVVSGVSAQGATPYLWR